MCLRHPVFNDDFTDLYTSYRWGMCTIWMSCSVLQRVAVCCSDSTLNYERVVLGICPVPYTYACVCIDHRQRRSDLKIITTAQFSNKQIFTGVPVHIKHVFTGVPRFSYTFLLVKTESPSLKGFDEKVVRSRNPNMSGLISSVSVSVLWGGYD